MDIAEQRLAAAVKAVAQEDRLKLASHPSPEQLIAYQERRLPPDEVEPLKDHLALCPTCAATVVDLEAFPILEDPEDLEAVPPGLLKQAERDWDAFQQAGLVPRDPEPEVLVTRAAAFPPRRWHIPASFAAGLLLAAVGAALWFGTQSPSIVLPDASPLATTNTTATAQVQVVQAMPVTAAVRRESSAPMPVAVEAAAESLVFVLPVPVERSLPEARIEVLGADGRSLWSADSAARRGDGTYTVQLPRALLQPEEIELRLLPLAGLEASEAAEPFAVYRLRLDWSPES